VAVGTVALMEGQLRRVGDHSWEGELHCYRVHIGQHTGDWYVWLALGEWTQRCLRVDSFGHTAWLVRARIERRGDERLRATTS
jgi:hypothetical protein